MNENNPNTKDTEKGSPFLMTSKACVMKERVALGEFLQHTGECLEFWEYKDGHYTRTRCVWIGEELCLPGDRCIKAGDLLWKPSANRTDLDLSLRGIVCYGEIDKCNSFIEGWVANEKEKPDVSVCLDTKPIPKPSNARAWYVIEAVSRTVGATGPCLELWHPCKTLLIRGECTWIGPTLFSNFGDNFDRCAGDKVEGLPCEPLYISNPSHPGVVCYGTELECRDYIQRRLDDIREAE